MAGKKSKLTRLQLRFVQEFKKDPTCSYRELARRAGYSEATAHMASRDVVPPCKSLLDKELAKLGVSDDYLAKKLNEGTNAFAINSHYDKEKGIWIEDKPRPDFRTRHRYVETVMKHRGYLKDVLQHTGGININPLAPEEEERVQGELSGFFGKPAKKKRARKKK